MELAVYTALAETLRAVPASACPHFPALAKRFSVSLDTVHSIYSQEVQARVIKSHSALRAAAPELAQRYLAGADLLTLCYEANLPPCTVLRRLLEQLPLGFHAPKRTTELLRDPASLPRLVSLEAAQQALLQGKTPLPADPAAAGAAFLSRLQADVARCVECDAVCGPSSDAARNAAGQQYEVKLYERLTAAGISFWTESALRQDGFIKTPDARLRVPMAVQGRVVCWIDSKATFGDERQHRQQETEQFQRYVNRYGPGMVIYWHGYLAHLHEGDSDVLLVEDFPKAADITTLPQLDLAAAEGGKSGGGAGGIGQLLNNERQLPLIGS